MKPFFWHVALAGLFALAVPFSAAAQSAGCDRDLFNTADETGESRDAAKMRCDLERASLIRDRAVLLYGAHPSSLIEIIDTASPSGAAYVYDVHAEGPTLHLEARSVPDEPGPRCRLQSTLPDETAGVISALLRQSASPDVPDYGAREEVTPNPDGSRTLRLVMDSHDVITRTDTENGVRYFSRHARSDDPVSRLNTLVIGIANLSPGWVCNTAS